MTLTSGSAANPSCCAAMLVPSSGQIRKHKDSSLPSPTNGCRDCCMQAMLQDCKKLFTVPSFSVILESIAAVGASGTGHQVLYIEVSPLVHTSRQRYLICMCLVKKSRRTMH